MTTQAQINANRRNAAKSTGPSEAGKRRSRMNAIQHGGFLSVTDDITSTLLHEDLFDLLELREALIEDLAPTTALQLARAEHIAQQIINQQRIHKLTAALANDDATGPDDANLVGEDPLRFYHWAMLIRAVGTRRGDADPDVPYMKLAETEHRKAKTKTPPPTVDTQADDPSAVARSELYRILEARYGSLDAATRFAWERMDELQSSAIRVVTKLRAIEARRLLKTFDKVTALSDRVSRAIARDLKDYYELKKMESVLVDDASDADGEEQEEAGG